MNLSTSQLRYLLAQIQDKYGKDLQAYPEVLVDAARAEDSPLHERFDWSDTPEAEESRLAYARRLIHEVKEAPLTEYEVRHLIETIVHDRMAQLFKALEESSAMSKAVSDQIQAKQREIQKQLDLLLPPKPPKDEPTQ
jgi:hypothetical protein